MKFIAAVLSVAVSIQLCQANVLQLNINNIDELVEGKTVFIKFFAPWCGHCKAMAADFEKLAADWEGHPVGLVAEVDCTDEADGGQALCEDFKIEGFPTIMYGNPHSPEAYEGGRDYESMSEFTKANIGKPVCGVNNLDVCEPEQKALIEEILKKSKDELEAIAKDVDEKLEQNQKSYEGKIEELQEAYEKMTKEFSEENDSIRKTANYSIVKQVLAKLKSDSESKEEL